MKILVVEDDLVVADALKSTLIRHNYAVEVVNDGRTGWECIQAFSYDLLLLDVILPELDGIGLCMQVRSHGYLMPILLLTSKDSKHDRAVGLDAGADDYVIKPFDPEELSARIRALLRRGSDNSQPILTWESLTLNPCNCEVTYQQQLLTLTPKEYALLELFLRNSRRLFSCGAILEHLWTYEDAPSEEAVRTHIKGLRHKLKAAGAPPDLVETVYGIGYRLKPFEPSVKPLASTSKLSQQERNAIESTPPPSNPTPSNKSVAPENTLQLLEGIWERHYALTIERVEKIERAIAALAVGSLTATDRHQAWQSAHTLAGTLGTFGLSIGSHAAKKIESLLDTEIDLTPDLMPQLQHEFEELQREIASKRRKGDGEMGGGRYEATQLLMISRDRDLIASVRAAGGDRLKIVVAIELSLPVGEASPLANRSHPKLDIIAIDLDCFADIQDGLAALSLLDRDYPKIPVLVLNQLTHDIAPDSAQQLRQRIEVARRGGRMFLTKPASAAQILLAVDRVLDRASVNRASILIVDDDRLLLDSMAALLSPVGMKVTTLAEPSRFWETLEACVPDLLILDLDMPMHDGIELCQAVRTDPHWTTLPIMFLTAHTAAIAIDRVFAAGADDFVNKPVVVSTLVSRIFNRLERIGFQK